MFAVLQGDSLSQRSNYLSFAIALTQKSDLKSKLYSSCCQLWFDTFKVPGNGRFITLCGNGGPQQVVSEDGEQHHAVRSGPGPGVFGVAKEVESARQVAAAELAESLAAGKAEEAHRQSEIRSELLKTLFTSADLHSGECSTLRELLDRGQERALDKLAGEPLATQQEILGLLYSDLGVEDEARKLLKASLALRRELYTDDHPLLARGLNNIAALHYYAGEYDKAGTLYQESLDMRRRLGQEGVDVVKAMSNLASIVTTRGEYDRAEDLYRQSLAIREMAYGGEDPSVATSLRTLGTLLYLRGDFADAEPLLRRSLEIRRNAFGQRDARVASTASSLGRILHARGELSEARQLLETVLATWQEVLGENHPHVALTRKDLAALLIDPRPR